jgi:hypothetical protein
MDEIERALSALHALDPGCSREQWIRIGMAAKNAGLSLEDFTIWSSSAPNYVSERDCEQVWRSFSDGGVKAATLYGMAFSANWNDPAKQRHNGHGKHQAFSAAAEPIRSQQTPPRADKSASALWERSIPATGEHTYILAKRGQPDGLRIVGAGDTATIAGQSVAGWLVVPALSLDGDLRTLQLIPPPGIGKKLNLPGASFGDGMFIVGNIAESARVFIVEGIGQAWACWQATGSAAVVCFGAGRMSTVANLLRTRYPELRLVVVPDRGKEIQAAEIARAVLCEWVELPGDKPANYDVNDFAAEYGADELAVLLDKPRTPPQRFRLLTPADLAGLPPVKWLVRGVLPTEGIGAVFGPSGSGKSFLVLDLLASVANHAD